MIIDFHTHIYADRNAERARTVLVENLEKNGNHIVPATDMTESGLLAKMDAAGIDLSVVQPVITKEEQFQKVNDWAASRMSKRIVFFGGLFPHSARWKEQIDYVVSLGLKGLKFHPEYQSFTPDDPKYFPLYDYALEKGLILLFHAGDDQGQAPPYHSTPKTFRHIWEAMRGGVIVAAHYGGHQRWSETEEELAGTGVYLDTSMGSQYYGREQFLRIAEKHGTDRILFATDSPWSEPEPELAFIRGLPFTKEQKDAVLGGNAARLLGIEE